MSITNGQQKGVDAMLRYRQEHPEEWKQKMRDGKQRAVALRAAMPSTTGSNRHELTVGIA